MAILPEEITTEVMNEMPVVNSRHGISVKWSRYHSSITVFFIGLIL